MAMEFHSICVWDDESQDASRAEWSRGNRFNDLGGNVNILGPGQIGAASYKDHQRLVVLKKKWDPENLFNSNHNIV